MRIQVLAIGETTSGKSSSGREWNRRIFQVFTADQVAGNIPVYGELEELNSYKQGGTYDATVQSTAGQNGRIELRITKLTPAKAAQ
jgi:hypothetical protein